MPGVMKSRLNAITDIDNLLVFYGRKKRRTCLGIFNRIKRLHRLGWHVALAIVAIALIRGIFFLNVGAVSQDYLGNLRSGIGAVNWARKAFPGQLW
jgi:hypothetical protein